MLSYDEFSLSLKIYINEYLGSEVIQINHLDDLESFTNSIENAVCCIIKSAICEFPDMFFADKVTVCENFTLLDQSGNIYKINIFPEVTDPTTLNVAVINSKTAKQNNVSNFKIDGFGKYGKLHVILSKALNFRTDIMRSAFTQIVESCYSYFKIKLREFISSDMANVSKNVYNYIFSKLCDEELNEDFWLAVVGKGVGFRLVNPSIVDRLFTVFSKHKHNDDDVSVNELIANMLLTKLPYGKILMKEAVDHRKCITVDLTNAVYTKEGSLYSKTMYTLYGGESFSIFPVYIGDISLVALYPVEKKTAIEAILSKDQESIAEIIEKEMRNITKAFNLFNDFDLEDGASGGDSSLFLESADLMMSVLKKFYITDQNNAMQYLNGGSLTPDEQIVQRWLVDKGLLETANGLYRITAIGRAMLDPSKELNSQESQQIEKMCIQINALMQGMISEIERLRENAPVQYNKFDAMLKELLSFRSDINSIINHTYSGGNSIAYYVDKVNNIAKEWGNRNL